MSQKIKLGEDLLALGLVEHFVVKARETYSEPGPCPPPASPR
ncbi:MAG: hypothetical protein ACRDQH_00815 [Pseudonocardiaceae bacterium]